MRSSLTIVLCGDEGVGKSSIIHAAITETFEEQVEKLIAPWTLAADATLKSIQTTIADTTPAYPEDQDEKLRAGDVVCVVYDVSQPESFNRVASHWLPHLRALGIKAPVVLVGNKIDVRAYDDPSSRTHDINGQIAKIQPVMENFREIETCVECSARTLTNVSAAFMFAHKAVIHPSGPLFDASTNTLRSECVEALTRIFRLVDSDRDGALNDEEMQKLQVACFRRALSDVELSQIKECIAERDPAALTPEGHITKAGFLQLHLLVVGSGSWDIPWVTLRYYGYGDNLELREDLVEVDLPVSSGQSVELSSAGVAFFDAIFDEFSSNGKCLTPEDLDGAFATTPGCPWEADFVESADTTQEGWLTREGFIQMWVLTTHLDYRCTTRYLAYYWFGGGEDLEKAFRVTGNVKVDRARAMNTREVVSCFVFGPPNSGCTTLARAMAGKPAVVDAQGARFRALSRLNSPDGSSRHMVVSEYGPRQKQVVRSRDHLAKCDVAIFCYAADDRRSFLYAASLQNAVSQVAPDLPCVYVQTRSDLPGVPQAANKTPEDYCSCIGVQQPLLVSVVSPSLMKGDAPPLFMSPVALLQASCDAAINPAHHTPANESRTAEASSEWWSTLRKSVAPVVVAAGFAALAAHAYSRFRIHQASKK